MRFLCLVNLVWLMAASALADARGASTPDERELLEAAEVSQRADGATDTESASTTNNLLLDLRLDLALSAAGNDPDPVLHYDNNMWRSAALLQPRASRLYPSTRLSLGAEWQALPWLLMRGLLDSGELRKGDELGYTEGVTLNGNEAVDELKTLDVLRELSVKVGDAAFSLEVGRFRAQIAGGLIYDDFSNGLRARLDLDALKLAPVSAEILVSTTGQELALADQKPLLALEVQYELGFFESLGLFVAVTHDKAGPLTDLLRSALAQPRLEQPARLDALFADDRGNGNMAYLGADTQLILSTGWLLRATLAFGAGRFKVLEVDSADLTRVLQNDVKLRGMLVSADLHIAASDTVDLTAYGLLLSGDDPPTGQGDTYHAFLGLTPRWSWTGLFFSGGLQQGLLPNRPALAGIHGHGVAGLGPGLEFTTAKLSYEARVLWLQALAAPLPAPFGGGGRAYGLETDLRSTWRALGWLHLSAELDLLVPVNYFPQSTVAFRALTLASFLYGS